MKEIKEFIQELYDSATSGYTGMLVPLDAATRIVSEAFAAGMNFQDHEIKSKHKFRRFEKSDINKVADFKYIPNPANGGDDDYIIADMVFREYTYGEDGTEPFCNVNALNLIRRSLLLRTLLRVSLLLSLRTEVIVTYGSITQEDGMVMMA